MKDLCADRSTAENTGSRPQGGSNEIERSTYHPSADSTHVLSRSSSVSFLRAPAGSAAVHALVAGAVAHHDASAIGTRWRIRLVDERLAHPGVLAAAKTRHRRQRNRPGRRVRL